MRNILVNLKQVSLRPLSRWRQGLKVKRWRKIWAIDSHLAVYQQLYIAVNGFLLSKHARAKQDCLDYIYGEIEFEAFIALISLCKPNTETIFYDLGSGTGKAVLACAMVYPVKKSCGIELFSVLVDCAKARQQQLSQLAAYQEKSAGIHFYQGNILEASFSEATLVFINASAFFGETWLNLSKHLEQLKMGAIVISTSKALQSDLFIILHRTKVKMSWGIVEAFIQHRQPEDSFFY